MEANRLLFIDATSITAANAVEVLTQLKQLLAGAEDVRAIVALRAYVEGQLPRSFDTTGLTLETVGADGLDTTVERYVGQGAFIASGTVRGPFERWLAVRFSPRVELGPDDWRGQHASIHHAPT
jgi:hypothetical protein